MMIHTRLDSLIATPRQRLLFFSAITLFTLLFWTLMVRRVSLFTPAVLGAAAMFDVIVGITLLYYVAVVRRGSASPLSIAPLFVLLTFVARYVVLAPAQRGLLPGPIHLIAPLELALVALVFTRIRRSLALAGESPDFLERGRKATQQIVGNELVADVVISELAVFYYALFSWRKRAESDRRSFTMVEKSGWPALAGGIILAIVVESIGLHLWLATRAPIASIIFGLVDAYSILWLLGDLRAMRLRPLQISCEGLSLRHGFRVEGKIPRQQIVSIRAHSGAVRRSRGVLRLSGIEDPNFVLELTEVVRLRGFYGIPLRAKRIYLLIDDPERFETSAREFGFWAEAAPPNIDDATGTTPGTGHEPARQVAGPSRETLLRQRPSYVSEEDWLQYVVRNARESEPGGK